VSAAADYRPAIDSSCTLEEVLTLSSVVPADVTPSTRNYQERDFRLSFTRPQGPGKTLRYRHFLSYCPVISRPPGPSAAPGAGKGCAEERNHAQGRFKVGDWVRIERDETRWPSKGA
jgi:hypothetical protein